MNEEGKERNLQPEQTERDHARRDMAGTLSQRCLGFPGSREIYSVEFQKMWKSQQGSN